MSADETLAKFSIFKKIPDGGDTDKGRVEHRSFKQMSFTLNLIEWLRQGQLEVKTR